MNNPIIEVGIAEILKEIRTDQKEVLKELGIVKEKVNHLEVGLEIVKGDIKTLDEKLSGQIKALDEKLSGQIKTVDERLSGQIKTVDEKLSGQIKTLDAKVCQIDTRIGNQEFLNRGIFAGLIIALLGGSIGAFNLFFKH